MRLSRCPLRLLERPNDRLDVARLEASFHPPRQARRHRAQQPILAAQFENRDNRRIVIVGGCGRVGIEHLRHRSLLCGTCNTARNTRSAVAHPHGIFAGGYLLDNGIADLPKNREGPSRRFLGPHIFDRACIEYGIEHRSTKPYHPWTTDVIDKCFLAGSELFSSRAWVTARRRAGREAQALPRSLHRRTSVAAPVRTRLGPRGFQPETKRA